MLKDAALQQVNVSGWFASKSKCYKSVGAILSV